MAEQLKLNLDPTQILQSLNSVEEQIKTLSQVIEEQLGKNAPKSINKMEKAAEEGSSKIASYFKNLGTRIKEDLKTAFALTELQAGLKLAEHLGAGVKEVFNLERAFDKLNTRLQLTGKTFQDFKKTVGSVVATTGQKLEDVFPGIETAAAKGNVKSPEELAAIGKALGQVRAATGESTEALAGSVVEILKTQGKRVTAQTFQQTLDALQATRVTGAFKTAGEAGSAIQGVTKEVRPGELKAMGLGTRELGGLAAAVSKSGEAGTQILNAILERAQKAGGKAEINALLGPIFKGEKLDVSALQGLNKQHLGKFGMEIAAESLGSSQADLARFVDVMKTGMTDYKKVTSGSNETATQFKTATNNLASGIDQYKQTLVNTTRSIGDALSSAAHEFLGFKGKAGWSDIKTAGSAAWENKGALAGAAGITAATALLMGGGLGSLMKKMPGGKVLGGMAGGLAGGELAKAAGATPVYVVNAAEIRGGMGGGMAVGGIGAMGKLGAFGLAAGMGLMAGNALANTDIGNSIAENSGMNKFFDMLMETFNVGGVKTAKESLSQQETKFQKETGMTTEQWEHVAKTMGTHVASAITQANRNKPTSFSTPSRPTGQGKAL